MNAERETRRRDKAALLGALIAHRLLVARPELDVELTPELAAAIHDYAAQAPSSLFMVQAADLVAARIAVNLPGTDRERPNWPRKLPGDVDGLLRGEHAAAILARIGRN